MYCMLKEVQQKEPETGVSDIFKEAEGGGLID